MITSCLQNRPKLAALRDRLIRRMEKIVPPERYIEYDTAGWTGPISIIESGEAVGLDGPAIEVAIPDARIRSRTLYAPDANGTWMSYQDEPHSWEDAEPRDMVDLPGLKFRPLLFTHLFHSPSDVTGQGDWDAQDLQRRFRLYAASGSMLRHSRPPEDSPAVMRFLNRYSGIRRDQAWYLQPTFLGLHLPFKCWPHCVWVDRISDAHDNRVFCQALTQDGYPLGLASSWPMNGRTLEQAQLDTLNDRKSEVPSW